MIILNNEHSSFSLTACNGEIRSTLPTRERANDDDDDYLSIIYFNGEEMNCGKRKKKQGMGTSSPPKMMKKI